MLSQSDYNKISAINRRNEWGFTRNQLTKIGREYHKAHENGDQHRMEWIEERLTDCNFHTACKCLKNKDFAGYKKEVERCFA